jgi:geranylgeranyl reductase family protein
MAAYTLARAGAKVALIERQKLPRHKTCGGGMPVTVSEVLKLTGDLDPACFIEADTRYMRHTWNFADPYLAPMNMGEADEKPISLWMVQRSIFDNALAQRAASAGADLRDQLPLRTLERTSAGPVRITAGTAGDEWTAEADHLIGADGANGVVARTVGLRRERDLAIAIELELPHRWGDGIPELNPEVCHLEYGAVQRGYAWVFPKRDHLNIGAGVFRPRRPNERGDSAVREELHRAIAGYIDMLGLPPAGTDAKYYAHPLPIWSGSETVHAWRGRVLLAGDAAGLINPFFGDGILNALKSGQLAAQTILSGDTSGYSRAVAREFKSNLDAALRLARLFYQWPAFCYQNGVKRPAATRAAARLLCGDADFRDTSRRVMRRLRQVTKGDRSGPSYTGL